jgi:hypothetical protein
MPYGKVDELAINTIRTLAVCFPIPRFCPTIIIKQLPRYRNLFSQRCAADALYRHVCFNC